MLKVLNMSLELVRDEVILFPARNGMIDELPAQPSFFVRDIHTCCTLKLFHPNAFAITTNKQWALEKSVSLERW